MAQKDATETEKSKPEPLEKGWRIALVVVAGGLVLAAGLTWYLPPTKLEFAPQATTATATRNVDDRSETTTVLLIGLAALSFVIAANGRKLTSVKIGGQEISTDVAEAAADTGTDAAVGALADGLGEAAAKTAARKAREKVYAQAATRDVETIDRAAIATAAVDEVRDG